MTKAQTKPASSSQVTSDLNLVLRTLQENPPLARALIDPGAAGANKDELISAIFTDLSTGAKTLLAQAWEKSWTSPEVFIAWVESVAVTSAWDWAQGEGTLEDSIDQVFAFSQVLRRDHGVRAAITDRRVSAERRQDLATNMLAAAMTPPALNVVLLAVSSRQGTIDEAMARFLGLGADLAGAKLAVVTVAKPLSAAQKTSLGAALQARMGATIIEEIVDPGVLGGVRVESGSQVIDDTVATRLEAVRRDFV